MSDETKSAPPRRSYKMDEWANTVRSTHPELAADLTEDRRIGMDRVDSLKLPRYKKFETTLTSLLKDPDAVFDSLESDLFYATFIPGSASLPRLVIYNEHRGAVMDFVRSEIVDKAAVESYDVVMQQYFPNRFGGSIVVNDQGLPYMEINEGSQTAIAQGTSKVELIANVDPLVGLFRYSFDDPELRKAVYEMMQWIPNTGEGRDRRYRPGYYEFALVERPDVVGLSPIFIDCKVSASYNLESSTQSRALGLALELS